MTGGLWLLRAEGARAVLQPAYDRLSSDDFEALSLSLFVRDDGGAVLEALIDGAPDEGAFLAAGGLARDMLAHLHAAPLAEEDWVALSLAGLPPVEAGRFFLHGGHDSHRVPPDSVAILIEANQAFGTGHHATTRTCLLAFDALLTRGEAFANVLDLGCGAGTLAIAAAKTLPGARVTASDNDPLAVAVTEENLAANGLAPGRVETLAAEGLDHARLAGAAPYDLIFANILAGPLVGLAPAIAGALAGGGRAILSGLMTEQRDRVLTAYLEAGLELESETALDGWSTLVVRRPV